LVSKYQAQMKEKHDEIEQGDRQVQTVEVVVAQREERRSAEPVLGLVENALHFE
jgi:hypothetical protein